MPNFSSLTASSKLDPVLLRLGEHVQVFVVGGAVRDVFLRQSLSDKDWVVVGATANEMASAGFIPVGADFPVFLHPHTHEEYALARTERKSGHGYKGFTFHADPSVTLEEDLARRDFTVNAMAVNSKGELFDPYGGQVDLQRKVMRHVSPAFVEDPLRVLRLARFLARFLDFAVAEETLALCRNLRDIGELKHLAAERVYAELNKGMGEKQPSRMLTLLSSLDAWGELAPGCDVPFPRFDKPQFDALNGLDSAQSRWIYSLGFFLNTTQIKALAKGWRLPKETEDLAALASKFLQFLNEGSFDSIRFGQFFNQVDLYRKPARLAQVNQLLQYLNGGSPAHQFIHACVEKVEQGDYKAFLGARIQHMQGADQVAEVAASARQAWLDQLHLKYF